MSFITEVFVIYRLENKILEEFFQIFVGFLSDNVLTYQPENSVKDIFFWCYVIYENMTIDHLIFDSMRS